MKRIFQLIFFFLSINAAAQSWYFRGNIEWTTNDLTKDEIELKSLVSFKNANYKSVLTVLPEYYHRIEWNHITHDLELILYSAEYEKVPDYLADLPVFKKISSEIQVRYGINSASGQKYLYYSFIPFRRNQKTGEVERLKDFIIEVTSSPSQSLVSSKSLPISVSDRKKSASSSFDDDKVWYKIRIPSTGIYKLSYQQLVDMGLENPENPQIFGWGGKELPEDFRLGNQNDLLSTQIYIEKGADNTFGPGDFILFYGLGSVEWKYNSSQNAFIHTKNNYSDYGYYFVTSHPSGIDLPSDYEVPVESVNEYSDSYDFLSFHEKDEMNLIGSGREFYGDLFDLTTSGLFSFEVPAIDVSEDVQFRMNLLSRAKVNQSFVVSVNNTKIDTVTIAQTNLSDYTATFANTALRNYSLSTTDKNITILLEYIKTESSSKAWLDYISLNARAKLKMNNSYLDFRDKESVGSEKITEFTIDNTNQNLIVWDVSDIHDIVSIPYVLDAGKAKLKIATDTIKEFIAFYPSGGFPSPQLEADDLGVVESQNLKSFSNPDMFIVSYPDFMQFANELADYRRSFNQLDVVVTTPEKIYNEFSSGRPDVTAIRNFVKYYYDKANEDESLMPKYLLLFGDGSYNNKSTHPDSLSFVPTYQSENSLSPIYSYVSDDYFALLDDGEEMYDGALDIGVGRLPISSEFEAESVVNKLISYNDKDRIGDWRNTICFIGDDEDFNIHMLQANELAEYVETNYPSFNVNKIFLDAYPQIATPTGQRYPAVNKAINDQIAKGALIMNYTGHGGTSALAHEHILEINDVNKWENTRKLPLFMTATCEFSRYDDPAKVSAGERVILNPKGGGIGLLTTTRLVYSGPNHVLNEHFYEIVFEKDAEGKNYCLGEVLKYSKNNTGNGVNKRNFTLLGDPSMRLSYPALNIITDSLNKVSVETLSDTIKALEKVSVSGHIADENGIMEGFDGIVYPVVYDKPTLLSTLGNDGGNTKLFNIRNNIIFKGKASVVNGKFYFEFIVPKDINYNPGNGKFSYYAADSLIDASGAFENFMVGGTYSNALDDDTSPDIDIFMNNENFRDGGMTDENPVLFVKVFDSSGINTTGNIGHDITASIDGDYQNNFELNDYYQSELDDFQRGYVEYPLFSLTEGWHRVEVKVWDVNNNSSDGSLDFLVVKSEELLIENLLNFPNPFTENTKISFDHNKGGQDLDISIDIFSMSGELIRTMKVKQYSSGFRSDPIEWNGMGDNGTNSRQGTYIYRITVESEDGRKATNSGKMIILRE